MGPPEPDIQRLLQAGKQPGSTPPQPPPVTPPPVTQSPKIVYFPISGGTAPLKQD